MFACGTSPLRHSASSRQRSKRSLSGAYGSDSNPCTFLSPCRNFQQAVTNVDDGGEVTAIDSAGFGTVTITNKSVSITSPNGVEAGIAVPSGGAGITINAGPNDLVSLRGLTIDGAGVGSNGIVFNSGASLNIQECVVRNFQTNGILASATNAQLHVSDTLIADITTAPPSNGNGIGIFIIPNSGNFTGVLSHVRLDNDYFFGLVAGNAVTNTAVINVTVEDSVASNSISTNGGGIFAQGGFGATVQLMVRDSSISNNQYGVAANGTGATVRVTW